jgi:phosphopantetheine--protein transferase-like protein
MILSIGTDIVEVYRIRETIARTPRFGERVFTVRERDYCESKGAAAAQSLKGPENGLAWKNNMDGRRNNQRY